MFFGGLCILGNKKKRHVWFCFFFPLPFRLRRQPSASRRVIREKQAPRQRVDEW